MDKWQRFKEKRPRLSLKKVKHWSRKKKILTVVGALIILTLLFFFVYFMKGKTIAVASENTTILEPSEFSTTVSATGTIEASRDVDVYTTQTAPIKSVLVEKGEDVQEGQVLAYLDDTKLRQQIRAKEAATGLSAENAAAQVQAARNKYNAAARVLNQGNNSAIVSAENALQTAKNQWDAAEKTVQDYENALNQGYATDIVTEDDTSLASNQSVEQAKLQLKQAQALLDEAREKYSVAANDASRYDQIRKSLQARRDDKQIEISGAQRNDIATTYAAAREKVNALENQRLQLESQLAIATTDEEKKSINDKIAVVDNQLTVAYKEYHNAEEEYNTYGSSLDSSSKDLADLNNQLADAEANYSRATSDKSSWESQIHARKDAVESAKLALEQAQENKSNISQKREKSKKSRQDQLETYRKQAETAKDNYIQAERTLNATRQAAVDELQSYEDSIYTTEAANSNKVNMIELANLYDDLKEMTIRAPMSGTVSEVLAKEGNTPAGTLFKIENLNNLVISAELKAFDLKTVRTGMPVNIKTDTTGDKTFHGRLVSIAHTATSAASVSASAEQAASASANTGGDPTFTAKIILENPPNSILAGMKARLEIITAEDQNVYAVPYGAVIDDGNGKTSILVAEKASDKKPVYTLKEIPVKTSLENELNIVIEGKGLTDGLIVITDPTDLQAGTTVHIEENSAKEKSGEAGHE